MSTVSRREIIQAMAAAAAACTPMVSTRAQAAPVASSSAWKGTIPVVPELIQERFLSLPFESQEIGGLLSDRMKVNVEGRLLHVNEDACLSSFRHRATNGDAEAAWVGEHAGKFLDAACNAVRYRENIDLRRIMDRMARTLIASQEADGYLGTYAADRRWTGWDVWVHKYNLIGLLSYYELTSDLTALVACRKMGDLLCGTFGDLPQMRDIGASGEHMGMASTSVLEPICKLYRFTGEQRYLDFANYIVRAYDHANGSRIVTSLLKHGSVYQVANGKAYEMLSNFNGLIDLYRITGDEQLLTSVLRAWNDIVQNQLYFTGTMSAGEHFQPDGRLLSLQSSNVGEMCVTVTWLQLNWRLFRLTGEARFGHELERTVYNHLLAAQHSANGDICYYTSLAGRKEFTDAVLCCVSSGPRGLSLIPKLVWGVENDAFVINLYTAGRANFEIDAVPVEVLSQTRFPLDGNVSLTVNPGRAVHFTARLRVPDWVTHFEVQNGSQTLTGKAGQMLDITQTWRPSSTLTIRMDLPTRPLRGTHTYRDYVALRRGPQVLALEKALNPAVPYLHRVGIGNSSDAPIVDSAAVPSGWAEHQVYETEAVAGLPETTDQLRLEKRKVRLVPFADAHNYCAWLTRSDRMRRDIPSATAYARAGVSVVNLRLEPTDAGHIPTDVAEFLTDEDPATCCTVDPRDPGIPQYMGAPPGKRGDLVWFAAMLEVPGSISRVIFRHGAVSPEGGWFDTSESKPQIEVARSAIPTWGDSFFPDLGKAVWERVSAVDLYPMTSQTPPSGLPDGQVFEVRFPQPLTVYAVRVVGKPGGNFASCGELSAYA
jgi:uncharacterized protein